MIDFRYHIVSVVAVFLALGLGILLGSAVVSGPLQERLRDDLERAREARTVANESRDEVSAAFDALAGRLSGEAGAWALSGRLSDRSFVVVNESSNVPDLSDHVVASLTRAGAVSAGTMTFAQRWALSNDADRDALVEAAESAGVEVSLSAPAADAAEELGSRLFTPEGAELVTALTDAGFLATEGRSDGAWPPPGSAIVGLSESKEGEEDRPAWFTSFLRSVSEIVPTLAASNGVERSAVADLRELSDLPSTLATFDAATDELDPGGLGSVACLVAAVEGRGGHFGTASGVAFLPVPDAES